MNNNDSHVHQIQIVMRKEMTVHGVKEVESFDEGGAVLRTAAGDMSVEGRDIRVGVLDMDRGLVTLSGFSRQSPSFRPSFSISFGLMKEKFLIS